MDDEEDSLGSAPPISTNSLEGKLLAVSVNSLAQTLKQTHADANVSARLGGIIELASDTFNWLDENANSDSPITLDESVTVALRETIEQLTDELERASKAHQEGSSPTDDLLTRIEQSLRQVRGDYGIGPWHD